MVCDWVLDAQEAFEVLLLSVGLSFVGSLTLILAAFVLVLFNEARCSRWKMQVVGRVRYAVGFFLVALIVRG